VFVLSLFSGVVSPTSEGAQQPLALRVSVEALGASDQGTVMGIVLAVAPEDRERLGERANVTLALFSEGDLVDRHSMVVSLDDDGSTLLYRAWPVGAYKLELDVASLDGSEAGLWIGEVEVPPQRRRFIPPEGAPVEAIALAATPPQQGAVSFLPPPRLGGIGGLTLEVTAPEQTSTVEFFRDDRSMGRRNRPPWTMSVSLGEIIRRTVIKAVARDANGTILGEDALILNTPSGQLGVEVLLTPVAGDESKQRVTVAVTGAEELQQVSVSLDDRMIARWLACPCVTTLTQDELAAASILVAEAADAGGKRGEAVLPLKGGGGFSDTVRVELVELPLTVVDEQGVPVTGLQQTDFRVLEDGQQVTPEGFGTTADLPLSLAVAVDISGSMREEYALVRQIVSDFVSHLLRPGDKVMLLTFAWDAEVRVPWSDDASDIAVALERVVPDGGTSLHDGIIRSLEQFRGLRGRQALVLLSDGEDTSSRTDWGVAKRYAYTMRIPVFTIGLGLSAMDFQSHKVLKELARETGGLAFFPKKGPQLEQAYRKIDELLRSQYLLWYSSPSDKPIEEFRQVEVSLVNKPGTVRTITGYYPGK